MQNEEHICEHDYQVTLPNGDIDFITVYDLPEFLCERFVKQKYPHAVKIEYLQPSIIELFNNRGAATHNIMEIKGILKQVHEVVERNNFKSRKVWLTTEANSQYPQTIELELNQMKVDFFNNISIGSEVNCHINLRGREWTKDNKTSVFNKLECWKVEVVSAAKEAAVQQQATTQPATTQQAEELDLPF